jgi:hypothetical protein
MNLHPLPWSYLHVNLCLQQFDLFRKIWLKYIWKEWIQEISLASWSVGIILMKFLWEFNNICGENIRRPQRYLKLQFKYEIARSMTLTMRMGVGIRSLLNIWRFILLSQENKESSRDCWLLPSIFCFIRKESTNHFSSYKTSLSEIISDLWLQSSTVDDEHFF